MLTWLPTCPTPNNPRQLSNLTSLPGVLGHYYLNAGTAHTAALHRNFSIQFSSSNSINMIKTDGRSSNEFHLASFQQFTGTVRITNASASCASPAVKPLPGNILYFIGYLFDSSMGLLLFTIIFIFQNLLGNKVEYFFYRIIIIV